MIGAVGITQEPSMDTRNRTARLQALGQSLWLDNITRALLDGGTLQRYIDAYAITGLTSNPTIFDHALEHGTLYDAEIRAQAQAGLAGEDLFFALALADLGRAADLLRPVHERTRGLDGWVSLEVSPLLAYDSAATVRSARALHARAARPNLFIKIPGTAEGLPAIEEATFAGVPVNVTLLFSAAQYRASAEAWLRGIERRLEAGLSPQVPSVASIFVSRWDVAVAGKLPPELHLRLGIAVAREVYRDYLAFLASPRLQRVMNAGLWPQRLLLASTGTKDPKASDTLYVEALAAPFTIDTIPDATLEAFAAHGEVAAPMPADGGDCDEVLAAVRRAGIDVDALAARLQSDGAAAFVKSWHALLGRIAAKSAELGPPR
ncbi:MAG: transaldolase [Pseudomonadota bacterium]